MKIPALLLAGVLAAPTYAAGQSLSGSPHPVEDKKRGDVFLGQNPEPSGAIARKPIRLVLSEPEDVYLFIPKPQINTVGQRCTGVDQTCRFEATLSNEQAIQYRWHAETVNARTFGSSELPTFRVLFTKSSPPQGYFIVLNSRRLDSPQNAWSEAEFTVHVESSKRSLKKTLLIIGASAGAGALVGWATTQEEPEDTPTARAVLGGVTGAALSFAFTYAW